ncbi:MAG: amidase [Bdellovibrionia bacterium]
MNEILNLSAIEMAQKIKTQEVSCEKIVSTHIEHIQKVNPIINAMVENNFDSALTMARAVDQQAQTNPSALAPLAGVPFTIKEMLAFKGFKRTAGNIHHQNSRSQSHATVVQRLLDAGAIPLGTTNVPEQGFWFETHNVIYGRTNNPYDPQRTSGGSSGGEAALLGAGASPIGLGSDIGGSIRMPAFFCGVFGHKPTNRVIPLTGHFPYEEKDFATLIKGTHYPYTSVGPMTKKAADLKLVFKLLVGPDGIDPETQTHNWQDHSLDFSKLKVLTLPDPTFHGANPVSGELEQTVHNCAKLFAEMGAEVQELDSKIFLRAVSLWFNALKSTKTSYYWEGLSNRSPDFNIWKEFLRLATGKGNYTLPSLVVSAGELLGIGQQDTNELIKELIQLRKKMKDLLGENGILILPPHPRVAPEHKAPYLSPFDFIYTGVFNVLGMPATSIPTGISTQGLPLGIQVVSNHHQDYLNFAVAEFLEQIFGGWNPPPNM